jgi:hypothetical protein
MGEPSKADVVAYQTRPNSQSGGQIIGQLVMGGWSGVSGIYSYISALETRTALIAATRAAAAGAPEALTGISGASRFSVYTLWISAFFLGVSISSTIHDSNEELREARNKARMMILFASLKDALDKHFVKYPLSFMRDESKVLGFGIPHLPQYSSMIYLFKQLHDQWWKQLDEELAQIQNPLANQRIFFFSTKQLLPEWGPYVKSRFETISRRYTMILQAAENINRS